MPGVVEAVLAEASLQLLSQQSITRVIADFYREHYALLRRRVGLSRAYA